MTQRVPVVPVLVAASSILLAGLLSGCATKSFVREEIAKSDSRVTQEVTRLDGALGQEQTRVTAIAGSVEGLSAQVTETRAATDEASRRASEARGVSDQALGRAGEAAEQAGQAMARAEEAGGRASQALAKAEETDQRLTRLWKSRTQLQAAETVLITFGFNQAALDDRGETALLAIVRELEGNPSAAVQLEGYTDNVGPGTYNLDLSQRRAEAVRRFLVARGIQVHRIHAIGLGDLRPVADNRTRQGREQNRRVAVTLLEPAQ